MNCLIVGCHPHQESFTIAIARHVVALLEQSNEHRVDYLDLYRADFNPVLTLTEMRRHWSFDDDSNRYIQALMAADCIVVVHPLWWGAMPALLSGWIQRIWKSEVAFLYEGEEFDYKKARGLFSGKRALVVYLFDNDSNEYCADRDAISAHWRHIFLFSGITKSALYPIAGVRALNLAERRRHLAGIEKKLAYLLSL